MELTEKVNRVKDYIFFRNIKSATITKSLDILDAIVMTLNALDAHFDIACDDSIITVILVKPKVIVKSTEITYSKTDFKRFEIYYKQGKVEEVDM